MNLSLKHYLFLTAIKRYKVKEFRSSLKHNAVAEKQNLCNHVFRHRRYLLVILIARCLCSLLLQFMLLAEKEKLPGRKPEDHF
jgi:hypothetical protein